MVEAGVLLGHSRPGTQSEVDEFGAVTSMA